MIRRDIPASASASARAVPMDRSGAAGGTGTDAKLCPDCGLPIEPASRFGRSLPHDRNGAESFRAAIRQSNLVRNDPTQEMLLHAEMHVANASTLLKELVRARSATAIEAKNELQSDARIKVEKNFGKILCHLQFATDCASGFPELHAFLLEAENAFQQEGKFADLAAFAELLQKCRGIAV